MALGPTTHRHAARRQNIAVNDWRIVRAALLKPAWPIVLARAENDDYASRVFYANDPVRALIGKPEGRPSVSR
jgi:hypothetical protein